MSHPLARSLRVLGLAAVLSAGLSACGGQPTNRSLNSVHQPVVERTSYPVRYQHAARRRRVGGEQRRLAGWFDSAGLGYGDKVALDDPATSVPRARPCRPCFRPTA
jgi:pilus assembly protein CpaD